MSAISRLVLCAVLGGATTQLALSLGAGLPLGVVVGILVTAGAVHASRDGAVDVSGERSRLDRLHGTGAAVVLTAVALVIRRYELLGRSTWEDEMWTLRNIYTADWGELLRVALDDYWPPLYYLILNTVTRVADTSLYWLRVPSVVFGTLTVFALYLAGRRILRDRAGAMVAAALLTFAVTQVLYSQESRVYALQVLLVVVSCHLFYRSYWERRISPGFLVATTLLTYSHSFASWYVIGAQTAYVFVAWVIWRDGKAFRTGFVSQVLAVVLWMPLVAGFMWARMARDIVVPSYWATGSDAVPGYVAAVGLYQALTIRSFAGVALWGWLLLLGGLAVWTGLREAAWARNAAPATPPADASDAPDLGRAAVFLFLWCTVPVAFSWAVTIGTSLDTFPSTRYHLGVVPGMCLLAGAGVAYTRSRAVFGLALAGVVAVGLTEVPRHFERFTGDGMEEAAALVRELREPGEPILVGNGFRAFAYYYRGSFPRIGSDAWDDLVASTAGDSLRTTLESVKWGDTYAYEKLPPEIRYYHFYRGPSEVSVPRWVAEEVARGALDGGFWIVLRDPPFPRAGILFERLEAEGRPCRGERSWELPGLTVHHCTAP